MLVIVVAAGLAAQFLTGTLADECPAICKPKATGHDAVQEVVDKINELEIFPNDQGFLCRIALVESKYGEDSNTYRDGYHGGIWQVDEGAFRETVNQPGLKKYRDEIKKKFGIDWTTVKWEDLERPLYSGLAARLYLARIKMPIPDDVDCQAMYWKLYYNTCAGKGTVEKFLEDVE